MKTKKIISSLAITALIAGGPISMTSCSKEEINTVMGILDLLFTSSNDLAGTAWISKDKDCAFEFGYNGQGAYYDAKSVDSSGNVVTQNFTYQLDTTTNTLTISLSSGTRRYTVTEYTKNVKLTLTYNGKTIYLYPFTE